MMRAAAATQLWAILLACIAAATSTLRREVNRYRETWQRRDQGLSAMPAAYAGTPRELLYRAFRENESARARMPTSARQFQRS